VKSRIYYFSSTGNSLFAARLIARGIGAPEPATIVAAAEGASDADAELVGIVFPVYLPRAPSIVRRFLELSRFSQGAYVFAVATNNGEAGSCMREVDSALRKGGSRLCAGFGLLMPGNSVIIADMTNGPEERARRLELAEPAVEAIARSVLARERNDFGRGESLASWLKSRAFGLAAASYRVPRHFHAGEACSRCGICARACPRRNVTIGATGPAWGEDCLACLGCYHACPTRTIDLDAYTAGRLRYRHPSVRLEELLYR
jgi:NAD-dependent dihydropyrimidine dehydrogenase PreA subunit